MIKKLFSILIVLASFQLLKAQEDTSFNEVIAFHPFHLINNGIKIDYDRKVFDNHWIQISPQFYASERTDNRDSRNYKELLGIGASVFHRIYLGNRRPSLGTYFSYGFSYTHYNLKYDDDNPIAGNLLAETDINKFGGDLIIGYQTKAFERLIFDVYAGLGVRYSDRNFRGNTQREFNKFMYDYGYTGNVLVLGIRIGFGF